MKVYQLLPLAAVASALVLPSEVVFAELEEERQQTEWQPSTWLENLNAEKEIIYSDTRDVISQLYGNIKGWTESEVVDNAWDALARARDAWNGDDLDDEDSYSGCSDYEVDFEDDEAPEPMTFVERIAHALGLDDNEHRGHHGHDGDHHGPPPPPPPHHGPPHHGPPHHGPPHHKPPHHGKPHHPHEPRHEPNETLYQLISGSKYTTTLAKLVNKYDDLVQALNSTKHNITLFAPTDKAFEKIPKKVYEKLSKKQVEHILQYHVVPGLYPAKRVLFTNTAATLLEGKSLGSDKEPQRIAFRKGIKGISVNFISKIVAIDIFGTNGVIHGVDTPIIPPPDALEEIQLFPTAFSTLELGLHKTGLWEKLNSTDKASRTGGTLFAPNNWAFQKLGPRVNAFLFSSYGQKYLKALLQYHIVLHKTLYTDAYYHDKAGDEDENASREIHVELPTELEGHSLAVDIARWGPVVFMKVNGFNRVSIPDGVAEDGVIHVMDSVIIPPKNPGEHLEQTDAELSVEELMARLEPYVEEESRKADL